MKKVDLRSDTVTLPTPEMYKAINEAKLGDSGRLGDSGKGDDPTVNKLEDMVASKFGMEDAVLTPSGTMSNLIAMITHTGKGEAVLLGKESHIYLAEAGSISRIAGLIPVLVKENEGMMDLDEIDYYIHAKGIFTLKPGLVSIENTHNFAGGTVLSSEHIEQVAETTHANGLPLHIDGARIFNASVALGRDVKEFTKNADSICFCLSKGLSAPIGSLLVGSKKFIQKARDVKKVLGGNMRQAGIFAAAGIVALENMVDRLADDHKNARILAENLNIIEGLNINLDSVVTNIVRLDVSELKINAYEFVDLLKEKNIYALPFTEDIVRMVTHKDITTNDIYYVIDQIKDLIQDVN